ncbi:hypothetical protein GCM10010406_02630 [Streptomyces thermolineatus]|uniref:Integral membrane protein n=1 Tax=Streptomyces thermolineatus TaxID=44033 RepID=A0ABN3KS85_9ACTN
MTSIGPALRQPAQVTAVGLLLAAFTVQTVGAFLPNVPLLVAGIATGFAVDLYLSERQRQTAAALRRIQANASVRQLIRDLLLVSGLLALDDTEHTTVYLPLVGGLLLFHGLHFACQAAAVLVRRTRTLPVVTRNIDASALRLSPAPPASLAKRPGDLLLRSGLFATAGLSVTAVTDDALYAAAGITVAVCVMLWALGELSVRLLSRRRPAGEAEVMEWLDNWLAEYRPTVGMYFSGGVNSAYQANMWVPVLEQLEERSVIVLRERFMVQKIESTEIPVLCIPKVSHLMHLEKTALKVMIHPANSGKTSQILRIPTIKHAFVNHGESDKLSSCNPYAKVYDEVWVSGPAARERYAKADVGVDDRDVHEIGRPQLAPVRPFTGPPGPGEFLTVLYAPTWEGWTEDPGNTSVILAGENIVRALLADPGVRLLYKPHPLTGTVDDRALAANRRIVEMIADANRRRAGELSCASLNPPAEALEELRLRERELDALTGAAFRPAADAVERMLLQGAPRPGTAREIHAATCAWERAYWASLPAWQHQVIEGRRPALYSCFNQSALLISDVSSVVSDYLASEKPYAVVNTTTLDGDRFREAYPTTRAAYLLTPEADGIGELLDVVRGRGPDRLAGARHDLKEYLLGPREPSATEKFGNAVWRLAEVAEQHRAPEPDLPEGPGARRSQQA